VLAAGGYDPPINERIPVSPVDRVLLIAMVAGGAACLVVPLMVFVSLAALVVLLIRLAIQRSGTGKGSKLMEGARRVPARSWPVIVIGAVASAVARSTSVKATVAIVGAGACAAGTVWALGRFKQRRGSRDVAEVSGGAGVCGGLR
jgi:hypothetical protein